MKKIIIWIVVLLGLLIVLYFKPFTRSRIEILDHMAKTYDAEIHQICLVKKPPAKSDDLYELIIEFNKSEPPETAEFRRLFIKRHAWKPIDIWGDNVDYESETATREDLDNVDFLGRSSGWTDPEGKSVRHTEVFVGEYSYYKE